MVLRPVDDPLNSTFTATVRYGAYEHDYYSDDYVDYSDGYGSGYNSWYDYWRAAIDKRCIGLLLGIDMWLKLRLLWV